MKDLVMIALIAACGGHAPPRQPPAPANPAPVAPAVVEEHVTVGVALAVTPSDAEIELDEVPYGPASKLPPIVALEPGVHQLVITREGYKPYRVEFAVSDKTESFTIRLQRDR